MLETKVMENHQKSEEYYDMYKYSEGVNNNEKSLYLSSLYNVLYELSRLEYLIWELDCSCLLINQHAYVEDILIKTIEGMSRPDIHLLYKETE